MRNSSKDRELASRTLRGASRAPLLCLRARASVRGEIGLLLGVLALHACDGGGDGTTPALTVGTTTGGVLTDDTTGTTRPTTGVTPETTSGSTQGTTGPGDTLDVGDTTGPTSISTSTLGETTDATADATADTGTAAADTGTTAADTDVDSDSITSSPGTCGDGSIDVGEQCDDGNGADGDGCSADCGIAHCLVPVTHPTVQAGEDDAACPTVWVMPGTYVENVSIDRDLVLEGVPLGDVVLDGNAAGSVVTILSGGVTLRGLVVTNGLANLGGGIRNKGTLTLEGTRVEKNVATGPLTGGGGIHSTGPVTLEASTVRENTLLGVDDRMDGAGVYVTATTLIVTGGSSIAANTASFSGVAPSFCIGRGGGVFANNSSVSVDGGSSISANTVSLTGPGGSNNTMYGGGIYAFGGSISVSDATIADNLATVTIAASDNTQSYGGGIWAGFVCKVTLGAGSLVADNAVVAQAGKDGYSRASGGGIRLESNSTLAADHATLTGNQAVAKASGTGTALASGGAVMAESFTGTDTVAVSVVDSVVTLNLASAKGPGGTTDLGDGGAFAVSSGTLNAKTSLLLLRSSVTGNVVESSWLARGGGVAARANTGSARTTVTVVNSTISGNRGLGIASGGGIDASSFTGGAWTTVHLHNATVTANEAVGGSGGGISGARTIGLSQVYINTRNSILFGNLATNGSDCNTTKAIATSGGYNIVGDAASCPMGGAIADDLFAVDPDLGPLADNGGPTPTHDIQNSPAVDAGNPAGCKDAMDVVLTVDQRGKPRPDGIVCDIGAVERQDQ